jgi:ribosomal protein L16 Arg81 hydroxylase
VRIKMFDCRLHHYCTEAQPISPIINGRYNVCQTCPDNSARNGWQLAKRDWVLNALRTVRNGRAIDCLNSIKPEWFFDRYYSENWPVVIKVDWPAMQLWTDDYLKHKCGGQTVEIQSKRESDPNYEINSHAHKATMPFGEYVDAAASLETNDIYVTANNWGINQIALVDLWGDLGEMPGILADCKKPYLWYGPAGTVTPLHHDLTNNMLVQVRGRKRVKLIAPEWIDKIYNHHHVFSQVDPERPDFVRHPLFKDVPVLECEIGPGDALFLPIGWWHHVRSLTASISVSYTNFVGVVNNFSATHPSM